MLAVDKVALKCCLESGCVSWAACHLAPVRAKDFQSIPWLSVSSTECSFLISQMEHGKWSCQALLSQVCFAHDVDVTAGDLKSSVSHPVRCNKPRSCTLSHLLHYMPEPQKSSQLQLQPPPWLAMEWLLAWCFSWALSNPINLSPQLCSPRRCSPRVSLGTHQHISSAFASKPGLLQ